MSRKATPELYRRTEHRKTPRTELQKSGASNLGHISPFTIILLMESLASGRRSIANIQPDEQKMALITYDLILMNLKVRGEPSGPECTHSSESTVGTCTGWNFSVTLPVSQLYRQAVCLSFLLHAEVMDQQHTSDNICKALQNMVAQWLGEQAGTQAQMGFVVTDGAANMIKALRDGRFVGVRCSAHVLHLVVKAALEDGSNTGRLSAPLESCRQISGHFHRSVKDSQLLREEQKKADLPEHRLKQDVGTRWNSTLDLLESILEQKKAIHAMSCHHFIGSNRTLGRADWALMEQVVTVLTPFRALTELLSKENASLAEVIPLFIHLSLKLDDFLSHGERLPGAEGNILPDVAALLTRLKKELTWRMEERMDNCPELMLATICDPRIKGKLALRSNSVSL
ncbi:zinc finger BED domain-containing protein 4-like [Rhinophrynus dorsalis]